MSDRYDSHTPGLTSPALDGFAIVPDDETDLADMTRAIYVAIGGDLSLTLASATTVTLANVPGGCLLPLRVRRVNATGTTAAGLVGLL